MLDALEVVKLREQLDRRFLEDDVLAFTCAQVKKLLSSDRLAIVLRRRRGDRIEGDRKLLEDEGAKVGIDTCLRERRLQLKRSLLFVPLTDLDTTVGVLVASPLQAPGKGDGKIIEAIGTQVAAAIRRARRLRAYQEIARTTVEALDVDVLLDTMLQRITNVGFDYAIISVADPYRNEISAVRAKNVPPAWIKAATHSLDVAPNSTPDIVTHVYLEKKRTRVFREYDDMFDRKIFEKYDHADLERMFAPILVGNEAIGVIEFGCKKDPTGKARRFPEDQIPAVMAIVSETARPEIALVRPYVLLEKIATHAMEALGAGSASIHVYEGARTADMPLGTPTLQAGAGEAKAEFLRTFKPRTSGFGRRAIENSEAVPVSTQDLLEGIGEIPSYETLYEHGVRALLAVPLPFGSEGQRGVLYIHFWEREHTCSKAEIEIAQIFARQVAGAILHTVLMERAKERHERAWAYQRLLAVLKALPRSDLRGVLSEIVKNLQQSLGSDNVVLYEYESRQDAFLPPVTSGYFEKKAELNKPLPDDGLVRWVLGQAEPIFEPDVATSKLQPLIGHRDGRSRFFEREHVASTAMLPLRHSDDVLGVLFVNYTSKQELSPPEQEVLRALAAAAAAAIERSRELRAREERRTMELEAMKAVEDAIATSNLYRFPAVLQLILKGAAKVVTPGVGVIMWKDLDSSELTMVAKSEWPEDIPPPGRQRVEDGLVGAAARDAVSIRVPDVNKDPRYRRVIESTVCEIAVPIVLGERRPENVIGVINFESDRPGAFSEDDEAFLERVGRQVVLALRCVEKMRDPVLPQRLVDLVRNRLADSTLARDRQVQIVLTAVTAGQGLGFSRAMLFELDGDLLFARHAIGPLTHDEAAPVWNEIETGLATGVNDAAWNTADSPTTQTEAGLNWLFDRVASAPAAAEPGPLLAFLQRTGPFDHRSQESALTTCAAQDRFVRVWPEDPDRFKATLKEQARGAAVPTELLCVPVSFGGKVVGVLAVDNEFLPEAVPAMRTWLHGPSGRKASRDALEGLAGALGELLVRAQVNPIPISGQISIVQRPSASASSPPSEAPPASLLADVDTLVPGEDR
jgi:GAF domain-containing protein